MASAFGGPRFIQLSYGCSTADLARPLGRYPEGRATGSGARPARNPRLPPPVKPRNGRSNRNEGRGCPLILAPAGGRGLLSEVLQLMAARGSRSCFGYLRARELHRDRPADQGCRRLRQGRRRAEAAPLLQGAGVRRRDRRRALALRITRGEMFVDIITNMPTVTTHVTDEWFAGAPDAASLRRQVRLVPPTQFIWSNLRPGPSPL